MKTSSRGFCGVLNNIKVLAQVFIFISCFWGTVYAQVTNLSIGGSVNGSMSNQGDVRYYRIPGVSAGTPLMVLFKGSTGNDYYTMNVRQGSLSGPLVGASYTSDTEMSCEVTNPIAGDYYVEVRNKYSSSRNFTLWAQQQPVVDLPVGQTRGGQSLQVAGDVRYFRIPNVSAGTPFLVLFKGSTGNDYYTINVRQGALNGRLVGTKYAYNEEMSFEVTNPAAGDYYVEVRNKYSSSRTFTLWAQQRAVVDLSIGQTTGQQSLLVAGDVRYYRIPGVIKGTPLLVVFQGSAGSDYYTMILRQGSLSGSLVGTNSTSNTEMPFEITNPTAGDYFVEVHNKYSGTRTFTLFAQQCRQGEESGQPGELALAISNPSNNQSYSQALVNVTGLISLSGKTELDFIFVLDSSGSLAENDPRDYRKQGVKLLLNAVPQGASVRAGLVDFDATAKLLQPLTNNLTEVKAKLDSLDQNGATHADLGIALALQEFDLHSQTNTEQFIILFSDGESQGDPIPNALKAAAKKIPIHSIFLRGANPAGEETMRKIALSTCGVFLYATNAQELPLIFSRISSAAMIDHIDIVSDANATNIFNADVAANFWKADNVPIRSTPGAVTTIQATAFTTDTPPRMASNTVQVIYQSSCDLPAITLQPQDQTNTVGSTVTLRLTAIGTLPMSYQWWFNGNHIPGKPMPRSYLLISKPTMPAPTR